jgi:hypothetical protein
VRRVRERRGERVSLCDILKLSKSSNNEILNYRYQNFDSCLTDSSIFRLSVRLRRKPKKNEIAKKKKKLKKGCFEEYI